MANGNLHNDSFFARLRSAAGGESLSSRQTVQIQNVNDPTAISYSGRNNLQIYAYAGGDESAVNYTTIHLSGFEVVDPDLFVDPVRVQINTSNGIHGGVLSLNLNNVEPTALDFNSFKYCSPSGQAWRCLGDSAGDRNMIFVTSPRDLNKVINGMKYISLQANQKDEISITIFDGEVNGASPAIAIIRILYIPCIIFF